MIKLGYALAGEEHSAPALVRNAQRAEDAGCDFAMISDHYHPWVDAQGQSPFVWCVIGGIAQVTRRLQIGTGVTCPLLRIHPAIIAQAAATAATMLPGRFFLGVGAGENLNEHILGAHWPQGPVRLEMLEEAINVIRGLWGGEYFSHHGRYYTVEDARIYSRPDEPPDLFVAADGKRAAQLAGAAGDGLIAVSPEADLIEEFCAGGGAGKPRYGQLTVCWAKTEKEARQTARTVWPNAGLHGNLSWEIKTPKLFGSAVKPLGEDEVAKSVVCGPDPAPYVERIRKFEHAGFDHVALHHVGPDQEGYLKFFERVLAPAVSKGSRARRRAA